MEHNQIKNLQGTISDVISSRFYSFEENMLVLFLQ